MPTTLQVLDKEISIAGTLPSTRWRLVSVDPEVALEIVSQFQPEGGVEVSGDPLTSASSTVGSAGPAVQWVAGGARPVRVSDMFAARTWAVDLTPHLEALERLVAKDPTLGRAPRFQFTWGPIEVTGFVTSLRHRIVRLWPATGKPQRIAFEFEVTPAPVVTVETVDPGQAETQYVRLAAGETFEALGLRYLGDPLKGELIRRENPELLGRDGAREAAGDRVKVLERDHPRMLVAVEPTSPAFLDDAWETTLQDLALTRGTSASRGRSWDRLPEVVAGEVV